MRLLVANGIMVKIGGLLEDEVYVGGGVRKIVSRTGFSTLSGVVKSLMLLGIHESRIVVIIHQKRKRLRWFFEREVTS